LFIADPEVRRGYELAIRELIPNFDAEGEETEASGEDNPKRSNLIAGRDLPSERRQIPRNWLIQKRPVNPPLTSFCLNDLGYDMRNLISTRRSMGVGSPSRIVGSYFRFDTASSADEISNG
jgi:hypothetical protein